MKSETTKPEMPEINRELFQKIHDQITMEPETHWQGTWESDCGSTRCVAGWAIHFATDREDVLDGLEALGAGAAFFNVPLIAERLLGLTSNESLGLFYAQNSQAAELVELYALKGREWQEENQV